MEEISPRHRVATFDLGTLSLRVNIFEYTERREWRELATHRAMPRLGDSIYETGKFADPACERVLQELRRGKELAERYHVHVYIAVGTSALRDVSGGHQLVDRVRQELGIELRVITGAEEASLIARGILTFEPRATGRVLLVDIGGGSTELSICENREAMQSISLKLGAERLGQVYLPHFFGLGAEERSAQLRRLGVAIKETLQSSIDVSAFRAPVALGSSGTIRSLSSLRTLSVDGTEAVERERLRAFIGDVLTQSKQELLERTEIAPERIDVLPPGAQLLLSLLDELEIPTVHATRYSLRHGLLSEVMNETSSSCREVSE